MLERRHPGQLGGHVAHVTDHLRTDLDEPRVACFRRCFGGRRSGWNNVIIQHREQRVDTRDRRESMRCLAAVVFIKSLTKDKK